MVSSQFRQKRQRRVLVLRTNNGVGYKKISKTYTMKKMGNSEESKSFHYEYLSILCEPLKNDL